MRMTFDRWVQLREAAEGPPTPPGYDPFTTLQQKAGDTAYFGVHDLSRAYRQNGSLPDIGADQLRGKGGEVVNADPINQTITVATARPPFHYGYHKLETDKAKTNRKTDDQGRVLVTLPVTHLQDITHLTGGGGGRVWLVVDGGTKYQQGLMKEIRRKEVERAHAGQTPPQPAPPQPLLPQPALPPQQGGPPAPPPSVMGVPIQRYKMQNRQVVPDDAPPLDVAHHDPSITSTGWAWKRHADTRYYGYVKG